MTKKRNNDSRTIADWTTKKLKEYQRQLDSVCYGEYQCFSTSDLFNLVKIENELSKRGVEYHISGEEE
jgi:hypothetical protein